MATTAKKALLDTAKKLQRKADRKEQEAKYLRTEAEKIIRQAEEIE
jgi:hypothetical protein